MESMEWGVDSRNFKWIPWNGGWTPYFSQRDSMEWGMDSILFSNGFHGMGDGLGMDSILFQMDSMDWGMDSILFSNGIHGMGDGLGMDSILFSNGFHGMGDGLHTFFKWIPWNEGWTPYFFKMDSMEWWMESILFPHGFH